MASYDLDLQALSGLSGLNLSEVRLLDSTLQHPLDWHLEQLHLLGAQTVPCNFHTWTPDLPGTCEVIIDLNLPVLTHISNIHSQRFDFQEDLLKASSLQLYTSSGNLRRIASRDLQSLTGQYSAVQGSIEAAPDFLEACPTSGANTLAILETEFPATIVTPILVGITSEGWRSSWGGKAFPFKLCPNGTRPQPPGGGGARSKVRGPSSAARRKAESRSRPCSHDAGSG